jgi:hypothetical protein
LKEKKRRDELALRARKRQMRQKSMGVTNVACARKGQLRQPTKTSTSYAEGQRTTCCDAAFLAVCAPTWAIYSHKYLVAGGTPIERAFLATVPLSPEDLHHAHPAIFRTPKAARQALRDNRRIGQRGPEAGRSSTAAALPPRPPPSQRSGPQLAAIAVIRGVILCRDGEPPTAQPYHWMVQAPRQPSSWTARRRSLPIRDDEAHLPMPRSVSYG